jgi:cold shock CspA family protein
VFVHVTKCLDQIDELRQGQRVRYEVQASGRKPGQFEAVAVQVL